MFLISICVGTFSTKTSRLLIAKHIQRYWFELTSLVFPPTKLVISGELPDANASIVIANHQSDADWWYVWELACVLKRHGNLKIILKEEVAHIPIIGWGIRLFDFILLKRNWTSDRTKLKAKLASFAKDNFPMMLLIFPEGTTINTTSMEKCNAFAKDNSRPEHTKVLVPRSKGLEGCLASLPKNGHGYNVYDMTIAYSSYTGEIPTWEMGYTRNKDLEIPSISKMMKFETCKEVHIHIKMATAAQVLENTEQWLDKAWSEKEFLMTHFASHQSFPEDICGRKLQYQIKHRWSVFSMVCFPSLLPLYIIQKLLLLTLGQSK